MYSVAHSQILIAVPHGIGEKGEGEKTELDSAESRSAHCDAALELPSTHYFKALSW